jgi:site-specific DNA recombinase
MLAEKLPCYFSSQPISFNISKTYNQQHSFLLEFVDIMMKVAIYARISTDRGEQNIKQQLAYVREFCRRKGYDIYKAYKDEKTGKTDQRNDYQRMLRHWAEGKFDTVVIQDVDRLTRNYYDGIELERYCLENEKQIISLSELIDFKTPYGRFMFRVKLAMNSFYVENLVEKIRIGVERAKKEGKYKGWKMGRRWKCRITKA